MFNVEGVLYGSTFFLEGQHLFGFAETAVYFSEWRGGRNFLRVYLGKDLRLPHCVRAFLSTDRC